MNCYPFNLILTNVETKQGAGKNMCVIDLLKINSQLSRTSILRCPCHIILLISTNSSPVQFNVDKQQNKTAFFC